MEPSRPTYREYERRRFGYSENQLAGIMYMLRRAFGSQTFTGFWRYWNPLFSYYLYYYCYKPLENYFPRALAVVFTFSISGAIHDFFASLILLKMYVLSTPVFAFWGLLVIVEEALGLNLSRAPFWMRATIHAFIIIGTFSAGLVIHSMVT